MDIDDDDAPPGWKDFAAEVRAARSMNELRVLASPTTRMTNGRNWDLHLWVLLKGNVPPTATKTECRLYKDLLHGTLAGFFEPATLDALTAQVDEVLASKRPE
jgi:hypothetical protein